MSNEIPEYPNEYYETEEEEIAYLHEWDEYVAEHAKPPHLRHLSPYYPHLGRQDRNNREGYVYLLRADNGLYKIGKAVNPDNRLETFSVKLPFEVEFEHLIPTADMNGLERQLHTRFANKRVRGEWFALAPWDVADIRAIGGEV